MNTTKLCKHGDGNPVVARGLCNAHYRAVLKLSGPIVKAVENCSAPDCSSTIYAKGLCLRHYNSERRRIKREADRKASE
jgi:hypothetical protein